MERARVLPFHEFIAETREALYAKFCRLPDARVGSAPEFESMRQHILDLYAGVTPLGAHLLESGQIVDCIPFGQQPALRSVARGEPRASTPARPVPPPSIERAVPPSATAAAVSQEQRCPEGTVPMIRLDLQTLTRFPTLQAFLSKVP